MLEESAFSDLMKTAEFVIFVLVEISVEVVFNEALLVFIIDELNA